MANVRAVKSGNWSDITVWNTGALPTTADDVYANTFTVTIDQDVTVLTLRTTSATGISAGGGFVCTTSQTITCTSAGGILPGTTTALTISGNSPVVVTVNSNLTNSTTTNSVNTILKSGTCTLNVVGNTIMAGSGDSRHCLVISAAGIVNYVGGVTGAWSSSRGILLTSTSANAVLNITGNINPAKLLTSAQNEQHLVIQSACTVNITGDIYGGFGNSVGVTIGAPASLYVTGNIYGGQSAGVVGNGAAISSNQSGLISVVGIINAQHTAPHQVNALVSTSTTAINLLSGPFICGNYGVFPYYVARMHLIPTLNNYIEFRDHSTNGALSPGPIASASRMVSADTIIDAPLASNVRFGVSYGNGAFTGTCRIPSPSNVSLNVPFDTGSTGTAFLSATDIAQMGTNIWNIPVANLTGSNTIGARMANSSTVDTMGNQLASLL